MCGIAGILSTSSHEVAAAELRAMMDIQRHRGPDGEGAWSGRVGNCAIALGHLRLAILDLTDAGTQPMSTPDGSATIVFNGEIYNYRELRIELEREGIVFRTATDTEVLLWALKRWGEGALGKLNGMWALAWLDRRAERLLLSRDRFGVKPLYYFQAGGRFLFASEIKAILAGAGRKFSINGDVAARFLDQSLLDAQPESFFAEIRGLPPGHNLVVEMHDAKISPRVRSYWTPAETDQFEGSAQQRIEAVRETFADAVRIRLRSDVPVGVLLSGGVDSSSIAASMRSLLGAGADLNLLSASNDDPAFDESSFVSTVARHLGSPVHFVRLEKTPRQWFGLLDEVIYSNDEPVGSFSTVAHHLLMRQARALGVTVILSGQGADEILCGYRKFLGFRIQELLRERRPLQAAGTLARFVLNRSVVNQFEFAEAKRYLNGFPKPHAIDIRGPRLKETSPAFETGLGLGSLAARQRLDVERLSIPALVHYEDRSSMAWGREIRLPFLDYRLVNLLLPADPAWKLRDGWTKWIFRKAMEPYLPPSIAWRKDKQGFVNPQSEWLKHELKAQIDAMLAGDLMTEDAGLVDGPALRRRYEAYCRQRRGGGALSFRDIFNPIALEIWSRRFASSITLN